MKYLLILLLIPSYGHAQDYYGDRSNNWSAQEQQRQMQQQAIWQQQYDNMVQQQQLQQIQDQQRAIQSQQNQYNKPVNILTPYNPYGN